MTPGFTLDSLDFRLVGPFRGGRVVAVAGHPTERQTFYFGSTGGGVWSTTSGGLHWTNLSDGFFKRASVGALALAPSDPNVLYAGMGESTIRGNVSHGDGVYRSTDAGRSWTHAGLAETRHIGKVRVHPTDPDTVYVAALGHAHGPNEERGAFRSHDGGRSWHKILYRGPDAGVHDLVLDPFNPRILYAAAWETRRTPWSLTSGGPGSGLFTSSDGGDTWTEISRNRGLPKGLLGKIGITASAARRGRLYAIVEAEDGAVFRSDDGGRTWERGSEDRLLRQRAWYYHHIIADPTDADTVWVLSVETYRSTDGGRTFHEVPTPHGDNHDLWIDPRDSRRMIQGNDGGATISFDGGESWSSQYTQPTAEFYHVIADTRTPYRIHGAQQDNTTMSLPSRSPLAAISHADSWEIGGGESGYVAVRPDNPDIIYAGSYLGLLTRYDHRTGETRNISVWPDDTMGAGAKEARYRFQWTFPIVLSPHDPNVLYATGNHVFRSTDEGTTWQTVSPDLTRNDSSKFDASGGPLTGDNTGAEYYGTVFAFAESPGEPGVLWAGSDDGLVHVSRDNGATWSNVTPPDLPDWALISIIEPSPHAPGAAYIAATRYKLDDFSPWLFKTDDYGATWTRISEGLPETVFTRVIREDPTHRGLLYAGTETGVWASADDGNTWRPLTGNLPVVPIHDLVIREPEGDLIVATHGRSFWILDDLTAVRSLLTGADGTASAAPAHLFPPRPAVKYIVNSGFGHRPVKGRNYRFAGPFIFPYEQVEDPRTGEKHDVYHDAARNPEDGAIIWYTLASVPDGDIELTFLGADGTPIRTLSSKEVDESERKKPGRPHDPRIPKELGLNRFVWNLRYPDAVRVDDDEVPNDFAEGGLAGPTVPPGEYRVRLTVGEWIAEQTFQVAGDPRLTSSDDDLHQRFALELRIRDQLSAIHTAVNELRAVRRRAEDWLKRAENTPELERVHAAAQAVLDRLKTIQAALIQADARSRADALSVPTRLSGKLAALAGVVSSSGTRPTTAAQAVFDDLAHQVQAQVDQLAETVATEVGNLNDAIRAADVAPVGP